MNDTILGLPINRFVTFVKPGINLLAGGVTAWLVAKVNILGITGLKHDEVQTQVAAGVSALLATGLLQLADLKWIKGHHIELEGEALAIKADPDEVDLEGQLPDEEVQGLEGLKEDTAIPPDVGDAGQAFVTPQVSDVKEGPNG